MDIVWRKALPPIECSPNCWGKKPGIAKAKAVRCTLRIPATGNLGANAIVCGSAGIATGAAFSAKRLGNGRVAVCFFGEGALGQGVLYEVMNLAQLFKLPVIYVCENNLYTEYTHYSETTAGDILMRANAFGLEAASVDGQDVRAVYGIAQRLVDRARSGRWSRVSCSATPIATTAITSATSIANITAPKQEEQKWKTERDPIAEFRQMAGRAESGRRSSLGSSAGRTRSLR